MLHRAFSVSVTPSLASRAFRALPRSSELLIRMPKRQRFINTYPRPTAPLPSVKLPDYTPSIPFSPPPPDPTPPTLPPRPPIASLPEGWTRTEHIIPAAYPRQWADSFGDLRRESTPHAGPSRVPEKESKEERSKRTLEYARKQLKARAAATNVSWDDVPTEERPGGLYIAAERWVRDGSNGEGLTLVMLHANGFHKEVSTHLEELRKSWHPAIRRLLSKGSLSPSATFGGSASSSRGPSRSSGSDHSELQIDEIWTLDDVHHAASMDLNAGRIGKLHSWVDGGRDIINFVDHHLPLTFDSLEEGGILPWHDEKSGRRVIGVGHSVGGSALVHAAHARPDIFQALVLVEPMSTRGSIQDPDAVDFDEPTLKGWSLIVNTVRRRSIWPTLSAHHEVRNSGFFKPWHPEVWDLWLSHGLVPTPEGGVQLATPSWAEAAVFGELTALSEAYRKLPDLEVPVGFIMSGDATMMNGETDVQEMVWRPPRVKNERVMTAGHLVPQEKPNELADAIWRYLGSISSEIRDENEQKVRAKL